MSAPEAKPGSAVSVPERLPELPRHREVWQSFEPAFRSYKTAVGFLLLLLGAGVLHYTGLSVDGTVTIPRIWVAVAAVLLPTAIGSAAIIALRLAKARTALAERSNRVAQLEGEISQARAEIDRIDRRSPRIPHIEGVSLPSLEVMIADSPAPFVNPVVLKSYGVKCTVIGTGPRLDVNQVFTFEGRNLSNVPLAELRFPISGDSFVPFPELQAKYYDILQDPRREHESRARLDSPDGMRKDLALPFDYPGVGPYRDFHLELQYTWASLFNRHKDYIFIDTTLFQGGAERVFIELILTALPSVRVVAYSVDPATGAVTMLGAVRPADGNTYRFAADKAEKNKYYLLMVVSSV